MNFESSDIVLRERPFWEAVDLGSLMYRKWLGAIGVFFLLPYALVVAALLAAFPHLPPWVPALAIWWLKPLWDRLIMVPAGVRLFDPGASLRGAASGLRRVFSLSLAADLSWRRFSPLRAYLIPVSMYEKLPFRQTGRRKRWLRRGSFWRFTGISVLFIGLEGLVGLSLVFSEAFLNNIGVVATRSHSPIIGTAIFLTLIYAIVVAFVEPLFTLSCFSAYVNRRTTAEGWDLQLVFSRLRRRVAAGRGRTALMIFVVLFSFATVRAHAQEAPSPPAQKSASAFADRAHTVLSKKEFGGTVTKRRIVFTFGGGIKGFHVGGAGNPEILLILALILRFVVLGIAVALVVFVIVRNWHRIAPLARSLVLGREAAVRAREPREEEALRADWIDAGRRAWEDGRFREAIAALYRGALSFARTRYGITVSDSATESECLRIMRAAGPAPAFLSTFTDLTRTWMRIAWGGVVPATDDFERIAGNLAGLGGTNDLQ